MIILNILIFLIILTIIIGIHEFGHFYFAKRAGILCHEFAIGMGPVIYQKRKGETVYSIRSIPLGGYVSMAGEGVTDTLVKVEQKIGINVNDQGEIYEIVLNEEVPYQFIGKVVSFDLYGKEFKPLFIEIEIDDEVKMFPVLRDARYLLSSKRELYLTPAEKSFETKSLWQRFLVIFAGPMMNFILAFILYLIIGLFVLKPNYSSNKLAFVANNSPASNAGLEAGDLIVDINGHEISSWFDINEALKNLNSATISSLSFIREGNQETVNDINLFVVIQMAGFANFDQEGNIFTNEPIIGLVTGRAQTDGKLAPGDLIKEINGVPISSWDDIINFFLSTTSGDISINYIRNGKSDFANYSLISANALNRLGHKPIAFQVGIGNEANFNLGYSLLHPFRASYSDFMSVVNTLGLLFDPNENLGIRDLSGPVGIFSLVSQTTKQGILALVALAAFLSINIGMLNLLPIPALDGGRLVFLGIEAIYKPVPKKIENTIINITFFLLLALTFFVLYNDILRLLALSKIVW